MAVQILSSPAFVGKQDRPYQISIDFGSGEHFCRRAQRQLRSP